LLLHSSSSSKKAIHSPLLFRLQSKPSVNRSIRLKKTAARRAVALKGWKHAHAGISDQSWVLHSLRQAQIAYGMLVERRVQGGVVLRMSAEILIIRAAKKYIRGFR
jgi:hypothetical protein